MPSVLEIVVAVLGGEGVDGDEQVRAGPGDPQDPGAVAAGWPVAAGGGGRVSPCVPFPVGGVVAVVVGWWPDAAVAGGVTLLVGEGHAPAGFRVGGGGAGQVAGEPG